MAEEVAELRAALEQKQQELETAGKMGKMLVEKCESISQEAAEQQAQYAAEVSELQQENLSLKDRVNELETVNESMESKRDEYASIVRDMETELEAMREEGESTAGDATDAARKAKADLEFKCRDLKEQVEEYKYELDKAQQCAESTTKSLTKTKSELSVAEEKLSEADSLREKLEMELEEKDRQIRSHFKEHSNQTEDDERHYKEQLEGLLRDKDDVLKKVSELSDMNNILQKQHEEDQTLLDDVKATNVMLREALETKELEWGTAGDNNLANFAPKESLLGEIEAHFNRFTSFGSPQKSSKMPNFMDVVKRDFENLAHRIHRLRQKMEKKWPDPPPAAGLDSPAPKDTPTVDTA